MKLTMELVWMCMFLLTLLCGQSNGISGLRPTRPYPQERTLSPFPGDFVLFWDPGDDVITFEVHARTNSWIGLGISRTGSMTDSDIFMGWINEEGKAVVQDRYARGRSVPVMDDQQDIFDISGQYTSTHTILKFSRKHDTCDADDIKLEHMNVKLIWAFGRFKMEDGAEPTKHERANRGTKTVILLASMNSKVHRLPPDAYSVDLLLDNQQVPGKVESLFCSYKKIPNIEEKRHVVMIEPMIQKGNEDLIYLMAIDLARAGNGSTIYEWSGLCSDQPFKTNYGRPLNIFARGGKAQYLPENTGLPVGGPDTFSKEFDYYVLRLAMENWDRRTDRKDSSGYRIWVTDNPREQDAGFSSVGDLGVFLPPYSPSFYTYGYCTKECLSQAFGDVPEITIFAMLLHVHLVGSSVVVRHIRDGTELPPIAKEKYHDKWYGDYHVLEEPRKVKKGDVLMIQCGYNTEEKEEVTKYNIYGENEICFGWFFFYPVIDLRYCETRPTNSQRLKFLNLDIGQSSNSAVTTAGKYKGKTVDEVMKLQDWRDKRVRDAYQNSIKEGEFVDICTKADLDHGISGYPADQTIAVVKQPENPFAELINCFITSVNTGIFNAPNFLMVAVSTAIMLTLHRF